MACIDRENTMTSKQGRFALALAGLLLTGSVWAQTAPETVAA